MRGVTGLGRGWLELGGLRGAAEPWCWALWGRQMLAVAMEWVSSCADLTAEESGGERRFWAAGL